MHTSVHLFVQSVVESFDLQGPVYDFGYCQGPSATKASSPLAGLIDIGYVGSDLDQDAVTDRLDELSTLPYPSESARTVCCINVLEHTYEPNRAIDEMLRLLAPGGTLLVCTSTHAKQNGLMEHYWRMTPQGIQRLLHPLEATLVGWQGPDQAPHTVFAIGCKAPLTSTFLADVRHFLDVVQRRFERASQEARRSGRWKHWLWGWTSGKAKRQLRSQHYKTHFALHFPMDDAMSLPHVLLDDDLPGASTGTRIDFSR